MKLELKHLAPYLPYGLKMKDIYSCDNDTLLGVYRYGSELGYQVKNEDHLNPVFYPFENVEHKPILRPLSDLKDGVHPRAIFTNHELDTIDNNLLLEDEPYWGLPYQKVVALIENHFDVFGLIDKGLAIDINTL